MILLRMSSAKTAVGLAVFVFWCSAALGDILLEGAIYCDSATTLSEMVSLARAGDAEFQRSRKIFPGSSSSRYTMSVIPESTRRRFVVVSKKCVMPGWQPPDAPEPGLVLRNRAASNNRRDS